MQMPRPPFLPRDPNLHLTDQRSGYGPEATAPQIPWNAIPPLFRTADFLKNLDEPGSLSHLPDFVNPLPAKIGPDEVRYLDCKGALSLPELRLQRQLLQAYIEFVHPYMPLLELHDFLNRVNARDGRNGRVSLLLYQAVMFAASAFVGIKALNEAGYTDRRAARKVFFQKARVGPHGPVWPCSDGVSADGCSFFMTLTTRATGWYLSRRYFS